MKCTDCVYYPKCGERPFKEDGCADFKDSDLFVELPFRVNQLLYYIEPATKYEPVAIDGAAYFKLVDDSKVKSHWFSGEDLERYLLQDPFMVKQVKRYFTTKKEAEKALEEVRNRGREKDVCKDDCDI